MGDLESITPDTPQPRVSPCRAIAKIKRHLGPEGKKEHNSVMRREEKTSSVEKKNVT